MSLVIDGCFRDNSGHDYLRLGTCLNMNESTNPLDNRLIVACEKTQLKILITEAYMPVAVIDHKLKDFDTWFSLFSANPPPDIGTWRLVRGIDDPNRVHVVGEMDASEVDAVKEFFASEKMSSILGQANEMSTTPIEWIWLDDVKPG